MKDATARAGRPLKEAACGCDLPAFYLNTRPKKPDYTEEEGSSPLCVLWNRKRLGAGNLLMSNLREEQKGDRYIGLLIDSWDTSMRIIGVIVTVN